VSCIHAIRKRTDRKAEGPSDNHASRSSHMRIMRSSDSYSVPPWHQFEAASFYWSVINPTDFGREPWQGLSICYHQLRDRIRSTSGAIVRRSGTTKTQQPCSMRGCSSMCEAFTAAFQDVHSCRHFLHICDSAQGEQLLAVLLSSVNALPFSGEGRPGRSIVALPGPRGGLRSSDEPRGHGSLDFDREQAATSATTA
jgi:hypothetical protein